MGLVPFFSVFSCVWQGVPSQNDFITKRPLVFRSEKHSLLNSKLFCSIPEEKRFIFIRAGSLHCNMGTNTTVPLQPPSLFSIFLPKRSGSGACHFTTGAHVHFTLRSPSMTRRLARNGFSFCRSWKSTHNPARSSVNMLKLCL